MQTIYLDICDHDPNEIIPVVWAKQGDVGRKFKVALTASGQDYTIPDGATFCVWYSGPSGTGNYSSIGEDSAFSVSGSTVEVELITQMLQNQGGGKLCLSLNDASDDLIGTWDLLFKVQATPGAGSAEAQNYYTAFSAAADEAVQAAGKAQEAAAAFETDTTLSAAGKAADAAAVGSELTQQAAKLAAHAQSTENPHGVTYGQTGAAPAGYGLGVKTGAFTQIATAAAVDDLKAAGWYEYYGSETCCGYAGTQYGGILVIPSMWSTTQFFFCRQYYGACLKRINENGSGWSQWEWINPPALIGTEYRTAERYIGKPVYVKLIDCGGMPAVNSTKAITHGIEGMGYIVSADGSMTIAGQSPIRLPYHFSENNQGWLDVDQNSVKLTTGATTLSSYTLVVVSVKYTKLSD